MPFSNVVLIARVDDPTTQTTRETRSVVIPVVHEPYVSPAEIIEKALLIGPSADEWRRY